jgi:RHS repeat-associated protein
MHRTEAGRSQYPSASLPNELVKQTAPDGGITLFDYDARGLRTRETSPVGAVTTFAYDSAGRLANRVDPRGNVAGANPADYRWSFTYDGAGRQKTVTDPLDRVTTMDYDVLGRLVSTTRPDGTTVMVYDPNGNVVSTTTPAGTTSSTFDPLNRVATSTDLRGKSTSYGFDPAGNRTQVTDPLGRVTTYTYDPDGRMTSVVDARGNALGANPADFTTVYAYDELGQQVQVTDPLGLTQSTVYDRVGNVQRRTDSKALNTTYAYDSMNRLTRVTAPVVGATNWTYTNMGYVATRTDPLSTVELPRVATWTYDLGGRKTEQRDAAGRRFTFAYDIAGNQTSIVDANANAAGDPALGTTTMTYDTLNRLTTRTYSDGTPAVSWTFDAQGRVATMTDGTGVSTYSYDAANRVASISRGADVWSYTYDAAGNVTSRTLPGGANSSTVFDDGGQIASVTDTGGTTSFSYDPLGNMTEIAFPNGVNQTRSFDRAARLAGIQTSGPAGLIGGFAYTRDANGNPTAIDVSGPAGIIPTESTRNTFDNANRLTRSCQTNTGCTAANRTLWTYNQVGSRLTEQIGTNPVTTYTYDTADQLTAITGSETTTFTYNANGDQLTAGADTFTYNTARQTTSASVGGITEQYSYDGNGNKVTSAMGGVLTSRLYWDTNNSLPLLVAEGVGDAPYRYTYAGTIPIKFQDATAAYSGYYLTDGLGTVTNLTSAANATVNATYRYTAYGASRPTTTIGAETINNALRFTGQHLDLTGNYNLRARHYNPNRGAFTQTDPMPYGAGTAFESAYVYAGDRPTLMTDPSGLRSKSTVEFDNPIAEYDPEAACRNSWQDHLDNQSDFGAGAAFLARVSSDLFTNVTSGRALSAQQSCTQSLGNFQKYRAPDYVAATAAVCSNLCVFGSLILTRYSQWWFSGDFGASAASSQPRHVKPGVGWDGNLSAGWFSRDVESTDRENSQLIDSSIAATSGSASLGLPTGPVNVSIGATTAKGKVNGTQFGVGFPSPPSVTFTSNWRTLHLNDGAPVRKLW